MEEPSPSTVAFWQDRWNASQNDIDSAVFAYTRENFELMQKNHEARLKAFLHYTDSVLDIGCGIGHLYQILPKVRRYVGIDFVPEFIEEALNRHPSVDFRVLDARDLSGFPDREFTVAICRGVEGVAMSGWEQIVKEAKRVAQYVVKMNVSHPFTNFEVISPDGYTP